MKRNSCYLLAVILVILVCLTCDGKKVTEHRSTKSSNLSDSCETSPVRRNVTLRGGIKAGYFHKLAQYVAMELCIQLCCQEKGCDVAFMIGKNCYGVKCFSEELCHVVPAKNAPRALIISKVDFRGEVYLQKFMPERLKCFQTSVEHNVTLKGGLRAGNFTAVGHVDNIDVCAKLCCVREGCDLALMVNKHCFMVRCLDKERCKSMKVINQEFRTHITRVNRTKVIAEEQQTVRALSSAPGKTSKLMCKNGAVQFNQTLLGGYDAGKFKLLSQSANMSACIRLCCGEMSCDVALMIERKCYGVTCKTMRLCQTIPAKNSVMLNHLSPEISFITSRNEEVNSVSLRRQSEICKSNVISYDVTLRGGRYAGKYKAFGPVDDMAECIRVCCMERYCDLAFMINGTCFTVRCHTEEGCQEVRSPGTGFKPMISYVMRERRHHSSHDGEKLVHKHHGKAFSVTKNETSSDLPQIPSPSLPSVDSDHYCTNSELMYNVTLRGGITAGKFRDRGVLPSMQECLRVCCIAKSCDLAFMLSNHCFSVTCKNQTLCEVVTARTSGYRPQIAYIYARSNVKIHEVKQPRPEGDASRVLPTADKVQQSEKSKVHNHKENGNLGHEKAVDVLHQSSSAKNKTKPFKAKKSQKRKHKKKKYLSNQAKLEHMYARERILLRKLSLLKLKMEMLKRGKHGGDKNAKDKVLLEAFEDEPKAKNTSLHSSENDKLESRNKSERTDERTSLTSDVVKQNNLKKENLKEGNLSSVAEHTIKNFTNVYANKNTTKAKNIDKLSEKKNTSDLSSIINKSGSNDNKKSLSKNLSMVINEELKNITGKTTNLERLGSKNISQGVHRTQLFSETKRINEMSHLKQSKKKYLFASEDTKESFTRTKELNKQLSQKNDESRTASLEEMINQTTELKDRKKKHTMSEKKRVAEGSAVTKLPSIAKYVGNAPENRFNNTNQNSSTHPIGKDLILLDAFSTEEEGNDENEPLEKHPTLPRNSSQHISRNRNKKTTDH
ncbi:uncharacterized protein LOC114527001 isoform X2 [Dendronephthya gigantea]|uniref:uncharacterized protein LOC114527001 isoform X2 n=1 Tax=Dendronephthya gigantea TaxID=151771 RepID=UPI00106CDA5F|nr:uncharacterized protein LOC114527001 isoform X2 [Dendronephthya gigantea]